MSKLRVRADIASHINYLIHTRPEWAKRNRKVKRPPGTYRNVYGTYRNVTEIGVCGWGHTVV